MLKTAESLETRATSTVTSKTSTSVKPASAGVSSSVSKNSVGLSESELRKIVGNDELKYRAALKIRSWLRICLLKRRERKMAAQLGHLQQQYELMLSNPQHFQETDLVSLMQMSPIYSAPISEETDPYRVMTEITDALLRSELRKHAQIVPKIKDAALSSKFKQHLQLIETGRREILQVYAQRVHIMANPTVVVATPQIPSSSASENKQNALIQAPEEPKPRKLKRSASLRWADSSGNSLTDSHVFRIDEIVAPSSIQTVKK
jgi:hypothetical protein